MSCEKLGEPTNIGQSPDEEKIKYYIDKFIKFSGINTQETLINKFMERTNKARTLDLPIDTMLYIQDYLCPKDAIYLLTCCKKFMSMIHYFWIEFQKKMLPHSIIPITKNDYKTFTLNASLDKYYFYYDKFDLYTINIYENRIVNLTKELGKLMPDGLNYEVRLFTHKKERESTYHDRNDILIDLAEDVVDFLVYFRHNSITDYEGKTYFTVKQKMDMRLYGFNPDIPEEKKKGEIVIKWITGEYNTSRNYDLSSRNYDEEYNLDVDSDGDRYVTRKIPQFVLPHLFPT